jgi:prepilin-type processing-associated H-X9-DG protein
LKQVGIGLFQYQQDYDEEMISPFYGSPTNSSGPLGYYKWMDAIYPYIKSEQVFDCPSNGQVGQKYMYIDPNGSSAISSPERYGSYAINATYLEGGRKSPVSFVPSATSILWNSAGSFTAKTSKIESASDTFWVSENTVGTTMKYGGSGSTTKTGLNYQYIIWTQGTNPPKRDATQPNSDILFGEQNGSTWTPGWSQRHLETMNILYCDGHVKALGRDKMVLNSDGTDCTTTKVCSNFTINAD